jgi:hypothetical protein
LYIIDNAKDNHYNWEILFKILIKLSPNSLYKLKFQLVNAPELEAFEYFLKSWYGRNPMLLQTIQLQSDLEYKDMQSDLSKYFDLIDECKVMGIVKKYDNAWNGSYFDDFELVKESGLYNFLCG